MKTIQQRVNIKAPAKAVYDALMDSKQHSEFTGAKAVIDSRVGGEFSAWDGYASGKNIELKPGKKIVQSWRADDWPDGLASQLSIVLSKKGELTELKFTQVNVPEDFYEDIKQGWQDYYWQPLKEYLENEN